MERHTLTVEIPGSGVSIDQIIQALNKAGFSVGTPETVPPGGGGKKE